MGWASSASAQDTTASTLRCAAGAAAACGDELLTNFGAYGITSTLRHGGHARVMADWGPLFSVGRRNAIGATYFASLDGDGLVTGPAVRFRHLLADPARGSIELALGVPLTSSNDDLVASPYGLIKWNANRNFGLALRPEFRRAREADCSIVGCPTVTRGTFALSVGMELGGIQGVVGTAATAIGLVALLVGYLSGSD